MIDQTSGKKKFEYKWIIVALSFLMVCVSLGFCSSTKSLFLSPVTEYLGVDRGAYSINDSCRYIATAVVNLFFGVMVAKFGPKKLILAGVLCLIGSMVIYAVAANIFLFYLGGILLGVGFSWTTTTMVGYVVNVWCRENKGTIMGAILASNGIGGAIAMQIVTPIIEGESAGYKTAYFLISIILAVLFVLLLLFFKDKKAIAEQNGEESKKSKKRGRDWEGIEWNKIVKKWWFYLALCCVFFTGFVLQGITGVSAAHMKDVGIEPSIVATVLSVHSIALACFKFLTGFIYDKFGLRVTTVVCSVSAIVIMILLSVVSGSELGIVFAFSYGVLSALALPLETIILPIYASDLFGQKSYGKVLGIIVSVNVAGYALSSPLINLCFDVSGSYNFAFYACAAIMAIVIIGLQFVINASNKERKKLLAE